MHIPYSSRCLITFKHKLVLPACTLLIVGDEETPKWFSVVCATPAYNTLRESAHNHDVSPSGVVTIKLPLGQKKDTQRKILTHRENCLTRRVAVQNRKKE